jgi:dipeptidyl aminopeptidase/acylaminoacyl peptidase
VLARNLTFGALAALLLGAYVALGYRAWPFLVATGPTPTPEKPQEPVEAPRLPGAVAFTIRGDIYVLRDGKYAPLSSNGRSAEPQLSRDGSQIVYTRTEAVDGMRIIDGQVTRARLRYSVIGRQPARGGAEEILVNGLRRAPSGYHSVSWYLGPAPSPDGRRLAVVEDDGQGAAGELEVVDVATRRVTVLSRGTALADPAWSPDGRTLAVTSYDLEGASIQLWSVDRPGTFTRPRLPTGEAYRPSYSPDGRWLLYTLRQSGRNDLHAFELASGRDVALTADGKSWNGVFSFDGRSVAFLREERGAIDLYAMELAEALGGGPAGAPQRLTRGEGIDGTNRPSWSP